jgi:hypothetical protein
VFSITVVVLWSHDPQTAMAIVFGPVFALMALIPGYLAGKGLVFPRSSNRLRISLAP